MNVVARVVSTQCPHESVVMFGSSANFLFRPNSDLDLCVVSSRTDANRSRDLQIQTLERLESILRRSFGGLKLIKDAKVPVIRLGRLRSPRGSTSRLKLSCDISADRNGFIKTAVLISYFKTYPWLLPLIRFVIMWAHATGLTEKLDGVRINTNVLIFMMLSFCIENGYISSCSVQDIVQHYRDIRNCENESYRSFRRVIDRIGRQAGRRSTSDIGRGLDTSEHIGGILLEFFKSREEILGGSISESFRDLLVATTFSDLLTLEDKQSLSEQMQKAYHVLAIHGNGDALLDIASAEVQRTFTLSSVQSLLIQADGSLRTHAREFSR